MNTLTVQKRNMETKARKIRKEGYVTGNLFGKGFTGSIPIKIEEKEAKRIQRECLKGSKLALIVDGENYDVLLKEMVYDAASQQILEIDFQALIKGEAVHSTARILFHNVDKVTEGIFEQQLTEIAYTAKPKDLIDHIDFDCSNLRFGHSIKVADLDVAKNKDIELTTHLDAIVATVVSSKNKNLVTEAEKEPVSYF